MNNLEKNKMNYHIKSKLMISYSKNYMKKEINSKNKKEKLLKLIIPNQKSISKRAIFSLYLKLIH